MERVLTCAACGAKNFVSKAQAGQDLACTVCGATNKVPTLRGLAGLPLAESASDSKVGPARGDTWGWRGPVTALCLLGLLVSVIYSAWYLYSWSVIDTRFNADFQVEADSAQIDGAGLDSVLLLWDEYSKVSLGKKQPPIYKLVNEYAASCFRRGTAGIATIVVLSLITFATIRSARPKK